MVAKFDDQIPLYRLSEMYDRLGIDIFRSVMANWVGRVSALLTPLVLRIRAYIAALDRIHTDDTPVDVLDPGRGKTETGRVWVYVFDGSGYQSAAPAAIAYYCSPDRKGVHQADHLASFSGVMHADGYLCRFAGDQKALMQCPMGVGFQKKRRYYEARCVDGLRI